MIARLVILSLVALCVLMLFNKVNTHRARRETHVRVGEIVTNCSHRVRKHTIFVCLNHPVEQELHYAIASAFMSAKCPQRLFIGVSVSEGASVHLRELVRSRLSYMSQPRNLADNVRFTVAYTRVDKVQQIFDECYRNEKIMMVVQGRPVFQPDYDALLQHALSKPGVIFTQFPPQVQQHTSGYPVVEGGPKHWTARVAHFSKKNTDLVPSLLINPHCLATRGHQIESSGALLDMNKLRLCEHTHQIHSSGLKIVTVSAPLVCFPDTDAFVTKSICLTNCKDIFPNGPGAALARSLGLSHSVTASEAVLKVGSVRRYNDLVYSMQKHHTVREGAAKKKAAVS